ncbi:MAG: 2OG-Fe(II) oxygenase [Rhodospirillaceae bacterium]
MNSLTASIDGPAAPDAEFQALVRKTYAGNPAAITALGARLVVGREAPYSPVDGHALLAEAARQGDAEAWSYLAVLAAAGVGRPQSWDDAYEAIGRAAALNHAPSKMLLDILHDTGIPDATRAAAWIGTARGSVISDAPRMVRYPGFLTPALCRYFRDRAAPRLKRAQVHDYRLGVLKEDPMRTNTCTPFSLIETDLLIQLVRARIARAANVAMGALEPFEVLHYSVGERYTYHIDYFHPDLPNYKDLIAVKGQRVKTCLVYLNDDYEGGETDFPKAGVKFRGRAGEALFFDNLLPDGSGNTKTLHAGLAPIRGEKWLLSQWIRDRMQRIA